MMTREQFVKTYYPGAHQLTQGTGLFPEIMMAQAIVESSGLVNGLWYPGESLLAKVANNYFGIKASSQWKGKTITLNTGEVYNGVKVTVPGVFRVYASPVDSMIDYVNFLRSNPRYTTAGVFTAATPAIQAQRLKDAGYATDPNYPGLLISVYEGFKKWIPKIVDSVGGGGGLALLLIVGFLIFKN